MKRGPVKRAEVTQRARRNRVLRARERSEYLRETRERAEWGVALLRYCEAAGYPVAFRKDDLIALRRS